MPYISGIIKAATHYPSSHRRDPDFRRRRLSARSEVLFPALCIGPSSFLFPPSFIPSSRLRRANCGAARRKIDPAQSSPLECTGGPLVLDPIPGHKSINSTIRISRRGLSLTPFLP